MKIRTILVAIILVGGLAWLAMLPAAQAQPNPAAGGGGDTFKVDPVHSTIIFGIGHMGVGYFYGRINGPVGEFHLDPDNPSNCSFEISAKAENVDTNNDGRNRHIKSADFLNAKQFPEISFKSTAVKRAGTNSYSVTGDLTAHGVTKSINIEIDHLGTRKTRRGHLAGFKTTFAISRSEFGVNYMPQGLGDEVTLMIGIEGGKK